MENKITVVSNLEKVTLTILEGKAPDPINLKPIYLPGDIDAVAEFIKIQNITIDRLNSCITFNESTKRIALISNMGHPLTTIVEGTLEDYPELNEFGINQEKYFSLNDMEKFIRMNRFWFSEKEKHQELNNQLKAFKAKVELEINNEQDQRGNKNQSFKKEVKTGLAADFALSIPLYKGGANELFRVDICYDVTDSIVRFWLESVQLFELQKQGVRVAFEKHMIAFRDLGFVVINQ